MYDRRIVCSVDTNAFKGGKMPTLCLVGVSIGHTQKEQKRTCEPTVPSGHERNDKKQKQRRGNTVVRLFDAFFA